MGDKANSINVVAGLIGGNARYGAAVAGGLVLGLVLLFLRDLEGIGFLAGFRQYIVGGLVVYTLGAALIAQIETNLNNHAKNQANQRDGSFLSSKYIARETAPEPAAEPAPEPAAEPAPEPAAETASQTAGKPRSFVEMVEELANALGYVVMRFVPTLHVVWFILLIVYLSVRACL